MTELKTLKDIFDEIGERPSYWGLQREAIKWVKELDKEHVREADININWIKHFFNLTEKDLGGEDENKRN